MCTSEHATVASTVLGVVKPSIDSCRAAIESHSASGNPIVLHNWRHGDQSRLAAEAVARLFQENGATIAIIPMDAQYFEALYVSLPPDKEKEFLAGQPIVFQPIFREDRAEEKLAEPAWPESAAPNRDRKRSRLRGFVDQIMGFFGVPHARDAGRQFADRSSARLEDGAVPEALEADNLKAIKAFAGQEARTLARETAMNRWSRNAETGQSIDRADAREIANSHMERQSAIELMGVAIAGGLNPADVHGNLLTMKNAFEAGRKIGLLLRGDPITVTVADAGQIKTAIETVRRGLGETEGHVCYHLLADALAKYQYPLALHEVAKRVLASGMSEVVQPAGDLT